MTIRFSALAACLLASALATPLAAQSPTEALPTKAVRSDYSYLLVDTITLKPGAKLWDIVSKHFVPAAKAAGVPVPIVYHAETGAPRWIVITPMTGGPDDMAFNYTADDVKWLAALSRQEGGDAKAQALLKAYDDGIATRTRDIVHMHK